MSDTSNNLPTLAQIREAIENRPRKMKLEDIAAACDVSESWIKQVLRGAIEEPSYVKIVAVYRYVLAAG